MAYATAEPEERYRLAACSPRKLPIIEALLARHEGESALVIGQYVDQLTEIAEHLGAPVITGATTVRERQRLYDAFRSGDIRIFINAGPFFGYQLGESATSSGEANMSTLDSTRHSMAVRDRFFWGLGGGPGISIPIGKRQRVELEGRFVYGLGNLWSSKRGSTYVQSSEMYFGATLNYFFRL